MAKGKKEIGAVDIKRCLENEPDRVNGRLGFTQPSGTECPLKWQVIAAQILKLPVAPWDDPGTVAGEIEEAK